MYNLNKSSIKFNITAPITLPITTINGQILVLLDLLQVMKNEYFRSAENSNLKDNCTKFRNSQSVLCTVVFIVFISKVKECRYFRTNHHSEILLFVLLIRVTNTLDNHLLEH